jgi:hypothetical protein
MSGIRTHEPSVRAREDISCLRLRGHCDRHDMQYTQFIMNIVGNNKSPFQHI